MAASIMTATNDAGTRVNVRPLTESHFLTDTVTTNGYERATMFKYATETDHAYLLKLRVVNSSADSKLHGVFLLMADVYDDGEAVSVIVMSSIHNASPKIHDARVELKGGHGEFVVVCRGSDSGAVLNWGGAGKILTQSV